MNSDTEPLTQEQRLVLQAVYDRFHDDGAWPAFIAIDRPLRREHGLDTSAVFLSLPDSLVVKSRPGTGFAPNEELRLRLRGVAACAGSSDDLDRFVRLLPWLAQRELDFEPEPGMLETDPRATSEEVRRFLALDEGDHVALARLHALLQLDNWGLGGGGSNADGWFVGHVPPCGVADHARGQAVATIFPRSNGPGIQTSQVDTPRARKPYDHPA